MKIAIGCDPNAQQAKEEENETWKVIRLSR